MFGDRRAQHIEGNDNIVADTIHLYDSENLQARLGARIAIIDSRIKQLLPQKLISPRAGNAYEDFSSEKLIFSLAQLGIPVRVGIQVAESLDKYLAPMLHGVQEVTTNHIRHAVVAAIRALDTTTYGHSALELWADNYARRYGNPNERLRVIHRDGSEVDLDYQFLLEHLIPHLIRKIMGVQIEALEASDIISKLNMRRMADEVLGHVKSLNVYAIRYKTLFNLAYDLAVQPPHPWFVDARTAQATVEYDLERATQHAKLLHEESIQTEYASARHSAREAIHHACSAILAYYGAFLGVSELGPLSQLVHALNLYGEQGNPLLWSISQIRQIEGDLTAIGESRPEFLRKLQKLQKNIHSVPDAKIPILIRNAIELAGIAKRLVDSRSDALTILSEDAADSQSLISGALEILVRVPGLRSSPSATDGSWLVHNIDSALFRYLRPRLMVAGVVSKKDEISLDLVQPLTDLLHPRISGEPLSNAGMLISNKAFDLECYAYVKRTATPECAIFLITLDDLRNIFNASDRVAALADTITSQ